MRVSSVAQQLNPGLALLYFAGTIRDEMILDTDFASTFLDLADVPLPARMQGKSVLPLAKASDPSFRKEWYYEYYEWPNPESVRPHRGIRTDAIN
jgi:arylsulfatase A-like enzyme